MDRSQREIVCLRAKPVASRLWIGTLLYIGAVVALPLPLTSAAVLLAAFVLVPLVQDGILLRAGTNSAPLTIVRWLQLPAALLLTGGDVVQSGWLASLLCVPWLTTTLLMAAAGLARLISRRDGRWEPAPLGEDVALMLVAIGGAWAFLFRLGTWPGAFPPVVAELTAVHFHFAGLVLPIIVGNAAAASGRNLRFLWVPSLAAAALLLAVGITFSPLIEWLAAVALILIASWTAIMQLRIALRSTRPAVLTALMISSCALLTGMALASVYATGEWLGAHRGLEPYTGGGWLSIPQMIPLHGATLAFGFALPALVGWNARISSC